MTQHTLVALFASLAAAEAAKQKLEAIGIPSTDIGLRAGQPSGQAATATGEGATPTDRGWNFMGWLFGAEAPESDVERYRTHLEDEGGAALSVRADEREYDRIVAVLESAEVIGIEGQEEEEDAAAAALAVDAPGASDETVLPTAREELEVGKRAVSDTRRHRIRRYVVERPMEASVALHDERVIVERRAPASGAAGEKPFEEIEVEVTETREEPVVGKRVVPGEEVVVRKEGQDRVETVRDTVRESRVEVDRAAAGDKPSSATASDRPPSDGTR